MVDIIEVVVTGHAGPSCSLNGDEVGVRFFGRLIWNPCGLDTICAAAPTGALVSTGRGVLGNKFDGIAPGVPGWIGVVSAMTCCTVGGVHTPASAPGAGGL